MVKRTAGETLHCTVHVGESVCELVESLSSHFDTKDRLPETLGGSYTFKETCAWIAGHQREPVHVCVSQSIDGDV